MKISISNNISKIPCLTRFENINKTSEESMPAHHNNYRRLRFHSVHGDNVKLLKDGKAACRSEGFCKGIAFSDRPIMINEYVFIKFIDVSKNWKGALRIGFTANDPMTMKSPLPKYACPNLTGMPGNWAKALPDYVVKKDSVLFYFVDSSGAVHYGIDSEGYGIFFGGVTTSGKLWAVVDIYGNTLAIEFEDCPSIQQSYGSSSERDYETYCFDNHLLSHLSPVYFHNYRGKYIAPGERCCANRRYGFHNHAYVFMHRPLIMGEKIFIEISKICQSSNGNLIYGITSCNPDTLDAYDLPDNAEDLVNHRQEYWIVKEDVYYPELGDLLTFTVSDGGKAAFFRLEMRGNKIVLKRNAVPETFWVDDSQPLWLFFNVIGRVSKIRLIGSSTSEIASLTEYMNNLEISPISGEIISTPAPSSNDNTVSDCLICCEEPANSVLYRCGHMCMCYSCAMKNWKQNPNFLCPICRKQIDDIIKTYR